MTPDQKKDHYFFEANVKRFFEDPATRGKWMVIHQEEARGTFDSFEQALHFAAQNWPLGKFLIQRAVG